MMPYARKEKRGNGGNRIKFLIAIVFLLGLFLAVKMYDLQVLKYEFYSNRAQNQHEREGALQPERGEIFLYGQKGGQDMYPFAANKDYYLVFAVPTSIETGEESQIIADSLFKIFDQQQANLEIDEYFQKKDKDDLAYELSLASGLPAELRASKEAEIKKRWNALRTDKTWLKVREEDRLEELDKKKRIKEIDYFAKLNKEGDPYEPIRKKTSGEELMELYSLLTDATATTSMEIKNGKVFKRTEDGQELEVRPKGIYHSVEKYRYYPEKNIGSHILGFVRLDDSTTKGFYGLEGFFDKDLAGQPGYVKLELAARRDIEILSGQEYSKPKNGSDFILTIDRSVEFFACQKLKETIEVEGAESGEVVAMDPGTGEILAMCSWPDFDPNDYRKTEDMMTFNNPAVFEQYEPGSVFKAITMASALDAGVVEVDTIYKDEGFVKKKAWERPVKNSDYDSKGAHGWVDMTSVLELSLNTGAIFVREKLGSKGFIDYVRAFGFGEKTGIELEGEVPGNIANLTSPRPREIDLDMVSFGQAVTVTPLQMLMSYGVLANGGVMMKPFIVKDIIHEDGTTESVSPREVRRVISDKAANLTLGMLVRVVEDGHAKKARIDGYFIGGKTGTAQIPDKTGYSDETIHTFIGIAPADNPRFVMLTKINKPKKSEFAEGSVVPLWRNIAEFMLKHYQVPKNR
jgi:cell division protein FtsI/penicillin-binding protein 2